MSKRDHVTNKKLGVPYHVPDELDKDEKVDYLRNSFSPGDRHFSRGSVTVIIIIALTFFGAIAVGVAQAVDFVKQSLN